MRAALFALLILVAASPALAEGTCISSLCKVADLLDLQTVGREVPTGDDTWAFFTGGGLLSLAFFLGLALEYRKMLSGSKPDWVGLLVKTVLFASLLVFYRAISTALIRSALSLGDLDGIKVANDGANIFAERLKAFVAAEKQRNEEGWSVSNLMTSSLVSLQETILMTIGGVSYSFAAAIVLVLKIVQRVMLAVARVMGPIVIGLSALPGPTSKLAVTWALLILELGSWGLVGNIYLKFMNDSWAHRTVSGGMSSERIFEDIAFNIVYAFCFLLIPAIAGMFIRGGGLSGVAGSVVGFVAGAVTGAAATAGGMAGGAARGVANLAMDPGSITEALRPTGSLSGGGDARGAGPASGGGDSGTSGVDPKVANIIKSRSIDKQKREKGE